MTIAQNLTQVNEQISTACARAGVDPAAVRLIAVSKTVGADAVREAYEAGQRMFGENRVQEFTQKAEALPGDIEWNLIGRLQTNKVKYIMEKNVFLLHSLDRMSLAEELRRQCEKHGRDIDVLVQANLSLEETKAGVMEGELPAFLDAVRGMGRLRVKGLMTIGPMTADEGRVRAVFAKAKQLYDRMAAEDKAVEYLSMGMSGDYAWAIAEGSNMVRVGTAVFGARDYTV